MTDQNNAAQAAMQPILTAEERRALLIRANYPHLQEEPRAYLVKITEELVLSKLRAEGVQAGDERANEKCKRCGGPGWYTSHTTGYPESIPCSVCNPQGVSPERLEKDPFLAAQLWRKPVDFADAYEGAREDLAIWKRRALEAERDLRAEQETSSRLVAELNAENGPMHMGEPAALASSPVAAPIQWPTMPPSKGQSPVLFEDGYAEGWAKCMDECRRAVSAVSAPVAGEAHQDLAPPECPITRRPFFIALEHPELGMVPTYGGPYDSYTIPHLGGKPDQPWHERELLVYRYDHDQGGWRTDEVEVIPLRIVHEDVLHGLEDAAPQASEAVCSCPSGDGSLRHPCAVHATDQRQPAADAQAWLDLFWSVAKELNCLPSSFVDGNEHVLRAARQARAALRTQADKVGDGRQQEANDER